VFNLSLAVQDSSELRGGSPDRSGYRQLQWQDQRRVSDLRDPKFIIVDSDFFLDS
jgi:hypothetical protein